MNLKVLKNSADAENGKYTVILKGVADMNIGSLIDVELKLKGKVDRILDQFPMGGNFKVSVEAELK